LKPFQRGLPGTFCRPGGDLVREEGSMRDLKIAAVCMHPETGRIRENLDKTAFHVSKAAKAGADIVCFPELSITGYTLQDPMKVYRKQKPDFAIEKIVDMAHDVNMIIIAGLIERSLKEKPYISQIVAGPRGLVGVYRKTHLSPPEAEKYQPGQVMPVYSSQEVTFGVQLCYESHFPEISTVMALKGAEILFLPHASPQGSPAEKMESWLRHMPSRAFDNGLYLVACNQVGDNEENLSFPGVALAIGPDGRVMGSYTGDEEGMMLVELRAGLLEEVRGHKMKYFMPFRRPELYRELSSSNLQE
jgi:predicted amidohydrolase